jgi:hypothetical protein
MSQVDNKKKLVKKYDDKDTSVTLIVSQGGN